MIAISVGHTPVQQGLLHLVLCWPLWQLPCWSLTEVSGEIGRASATADKPFSLSVSTTGRLRGLVRADRLTRFPLLSVPLAIYQTEVPSKQEFHTLLTMWLLSAAAPGPFNRGSSFRPLLASFYVSSCLILILQGGSSFLVLKRKVRGRDVKNQGWMDGWLRDDVGLGCGIGGVLI